MSSLPHASGGSHADLRARIVCGRGGVCATIDGFNVVAVPEHPYGSASAREALSAARHTSANAVAIVPFLWQRTPQHAGIVRGDDMPDAGLRLAIREAHALGSRSW